MNAISKVIISSKKLIFLRLNFIYLKLSRKLVTVSSK